LLSAQWLSQKKGRHQQHQRRVEVKNQSAKPRRDVLQSREIKEAAEVVAEEAERGNAEDLACGERRIRLACPPGHQREQRCRE